MKKSLLFFAILALAATACEKEIADNNSNKVNPEEGTYLLEIKATIDEPDIVDNAIQSKATYSASKVVFAVGDEIGVLGTADGSTWTAYTLRATSIENNTITFSATVPDGTTIGDYAYYPASIIYDDTRTDPIYFKWPSSVDGTKVQVPMIGIIDTESATKSTTFKHLGAVAEITLDGLVPGGATTLEFTNGDNMVGDYYFTLSNGTPTTSGVSLNSCVIDVAISGPGTYYFPLPVKNSGYSNFTISLKNDSKTYTTRTSQSGTTDINPGRGQHVNFGSFAYYDDMYMICAAQSWNLSSTAIRYIQTGEHTYRAAAANGTGENMGYKILAGSDIGTTNWSYAYGSNSNENWSDSYVLGGANNCTFSYGSNIFSSVLDLSANTFTNTNITTSDGYDFGNVSICGDCNSWGDTDFTELAPHNWVLTNFAVGDNKTYKFKFREDHCWDYGGNWGGGVAINNSQLYGTCTNGSNTDNSYTLTAGTYTIYFNDVTGDFMFVKQ